MRRRLHDLSLSIWTQLNDLPYPAYLLSMAVIGKQLTEIYADQFPEKGRLLAGKTVDAVKTAYLSGEAAADDAWQLHLGCNSGSMMSMTQIMRRMGQRRCSAP